MQQYDLTGKINWNARFFFSSSGNVSNEVSNAMKCGVVTFHDGGKVGRSDTTLITFFSYYGHILVTICNNFKGSGSTPSYFNGHIWSLISMHLTSFLIAKKWAIVFSSNHINVWFMSFGQSVECWNWCCIAIFFNCGQVLQFGTHSRYYKGALFQNR